MKAEKAIDAIIPESLAEALDQANDMQVAIAAGVFQNLARTKIDIGGGIQIPLLGSALGENRRKFPNAAVYETITTELLAARSQAIALAYDVINALTGFPMDRFGTQEQRERLLVPMIEQASAFLSFAITEPNAGSASLTGMSANAKEITPDPVSGKRRFILNGAKQFITVGTKAGHVIFFAITDPDAHKAKPSSGVTYFVVPIKPSAEEDKELEVDGLKVKKWATRIAHKTLSTHHGSGTAWINADNVILTEDDILGGKEGLNNGAKMYFKILDSGRVSISSISIGGLSRDQSDILARYRDILATGTVPEMVSEKWEEELLSLTAHTYGNRLLLLDAARKKDIREAEEFQKVPDDQLTAFNFPAAMAKLRAGEDQVRHNMAALELFGREALRPGSRNRNFRDGKLETIGEGTSEIMRYIIAKKAGSGDKDIVPPSVRQLISGLIELYEQHKEGRHADQNRIFLERLQSDMADLITDARRLGARPGRNDKTW